jgi:hypothetical protein
MVGNVQGGGSLPQRQKDAAARAFETIVVELGDGAVQVLELDEDEIANKYGVTVMRCKRPKMWQITGPRSAMEKLVVDFSERTNNDIHAWDFPQGFYRSAKVAVSKIRIALGQ